MGGTRAGILFVLGLLSAVRAAPCPYEGLSPSAPAESAYAVDGAIAVTPSLAFDAVINPMGNFDAYRGADRIVLLADGASQSPGTNVYLGYQVAGAVPGAQVVRSDFHIPQTRRMGNLEERHVDNREPLPFADDAVDMLVMRRGLCACHGHVTCGGIDSRTPASILPFLREAARVLNKKNPRSGVYFVNEGGDAQSIDKWKETARLLLREYPELKVDILTSATGLFNGVVLRPR